MEHCCNKALRSDFLHPLIMQGPGLTAGRKPPHTRLADMPMPGYTFITMVRVFSFAYSCSIPDMLTASRNRDRLKLS